MPEEIEIIGKAIEPDLMGKKVTTAEFVSVIELCIDSFQRQIINAEQVKTRGSSPAFTVFFEDEFLNEREEFLNERIQNIITEANDMIKELKRIAAIAISFS